MSIHSVTASAVPSSPAGTALEGSAFKALLVGLVAIAITVGGIMVSGGYAVAMSWLVGMSFWTSIAIGMLLWILIHHIFDASWSVILRRQFEHGVSAFKWLGLLFLPLVVLAWMKPGLVWSWMDLGHPLHGGHATVADDPLYVKKAGFLNLNMFTGMTVAFFVIWVWLSSKVRQASFQQDVDGDVKWTFTNRKTAAFGIPLMALSLTFASIYWIKSLEYHWYSTMYGVWFFANCMRGALSVGVLMLLWLYARGDLKGILNTNHLHSIGQLVFAFTVFWAYITFSQYFLIWNANIPEETFWYNLREITLDGKPSQWKYVGLLILFGHFFLPFLYLLSYKNKVIASRLKPIVIWILGIILVDLCYNILPAMKDPEGNPLPFLSIQLLWTLTSVVGIGGVCLWAYLKSFPTQKVIPIRDPRIGECLTHHE